jgi:hypothetical protein
MPREGYTSQTMRTPDKAALDQLQRETEIPMLDLVHEVIENYQRGECPECGCKIERKHHKC